MKKLCLDCVQKPFNRFLISTNKPVLGQVTESHILVQNSFLSQNSLGSKIISLFTDIGTAPTADGKRSGLQ